MGFTTLVSLRAAAWSRGEKSKRWKKYETKNYNNLTSTQKGPGVGSLKSKAPDPCSKKKDDDQKNTDLSPQYSSQQNLR